MTDLVKRLRIKAGMIDMGERIAWGSDSALMREAADMIEQLMARDGQYTAEDMCSQAAQGYRDGYAAAKGEGCQPADVAPAVQGEPVAYMFADEWGRTKIVLGKETAEHWAPPGETIEPLYTAPQPAEQQPDVTQLVEALEEISDPIRFMEERLEEGERLNGMAAVQLAGDASYLRGIARSVLAAYQKREEGK